jgi:hypothetical protein
MMPASQYRGHAALSGILQRTSGLQGVVRGYLVRMMAAADASSVRLINRESKLRRHNKSESTSISLRVWPILQKNDG